jgi:hypothetical protein
MPFDAQARIAEVDQPARAKPALRSEERFGADIARFDQAAASRRK